MVMVRMGFRTEGMLRWTQILFGGTSVRVRVNGFQSDSFPITSSLAQGGVCYSRLGHREGAYDPCPKWARIYRLMTESGSKAFPASRAPKSRNHNRNKLLLQWESNS